MSNAASQLVTLQSHAPSQQARIADNGTLAWILSALSISTKIIANMEAGPRRSGWRIAVSEEVRF